MNKLAGRRGISKDWSTDSDSESEEEIAETGSKGSMNRPSANKAQSDAETEHSTQHRQTDKADAKHLLNGRKRSAFMLGFLTNSMHLLLLGRIVVVALC